MLKLSPLSMVSESSVGSIKSRDAPPEVGEPYTRDIIRSVGCRPWVKLVKEPRMSLLVLPHFRQFYLPFVS